jgi:hypothetical protein
VLTVIRLVLLCSAVLNVLLATVLWRRVGIPLAARGRALLSQRGAHAPAFLTDERVQRIWAIASGLVVGALAWYLGTPTGAAALRSLGVPGAP